MLTQRLLGATIVAMLVGVGLTGCAQAPNEEKIEGAIGAVEGVSAASMNCTTPLPFTFSCSISISLLPTVTATQLGGLIGVLPTYATHHGVEISTPEVAGMGNAILEFDTDYDLPDGVTPNGLAEYFLTQGELSTDDEFSLDPVGYRGATLVANLPLVSDAALFARAHAALDAIPSIAVDLSTDSLTLDGDAAAYPQAEEDFYTAFTTEYPAVVGQIYADYVQVGLGGGADIAAARAFAHSLPTYAAIDAVVISDNDKVSNSYSDPDVALSVQAVTDAASVLPEFQTAEVYGNRVSFDVTSTADARALDTALHGTPEYATVAATYSTPDSTIARDAGEEFPFDIWEYLVESPAIQDVEIDSGEVDVDGTDGVTPYDLGLALGASGLAETNYSVVAATRSTGNTRMYSTWFTSGTTISVKADQWMSVDQAKGLAQGWTDGQR